MTEIPNHSFAILAYGESPYLANCVESLLNQSISSQIFISTSTPNSLIEGIARKYSLPLCVNTAKPGIASDWNFGYASAQTDYVTLAHQDDLYLPDYTRLLLASAQRSSDNLISFCDYSELRGTQEIKYNLNLIIKKLLIAPFFLFSAHLHSIPLKRALLSFGSPLSCPVIMYNKNNIGDFAFDQEFKVSLDWEAWLRLANRSGSFTYRKGCLVQHRVHENSETTSGIEKRIRHNEDYQLYLKIWPKPIADSLSKLYSLSYNSNKTQ